MGVEDRCLNKRHSSVAFWTPKGKQGMAEDYIYVAMTSVPRVTVSCCGATVRWG